MITCQSTPIYHYKANECNHRKLFLFLHRNLYQWMALLLVLQHVLMAAEQCCNLTAGCQLFTDIKKVVGCQMLKPKYTHIFGPQSIFIYWESLYHSWIACMVALVSTTRTPFEDNVTHHGVVKTVHFKSWVLLQGQFQTRGASPKAMTL